MRGLVIVSIRGRCTLDKIYKFNNMLETYHREVIEGTMLKSILQYQPFAMQRDLITALVKVCGGRHLG